MKKFLIILGRIFLVLLTVIVFVFGTLMTGIYIINRGSSTEVRNLYVSTLLETGAMKFAAGIFLSDEELEEIVSSVSMKEMEVDIDSSMITVASEDTDKDTEEDSDSVPLDTIEIEKMAGRTFTATIMIVHDPSRIYCATSYPWGGNGYSLETYVKRNEATGGINGGLFDNSDLKTGTPIGPVVSKGKVLNTSMGAPGLYMIGFDEDNILQIIDLKGVSAGQVKDIVAQYRIRDAVTFQDYLDGTNSHFVPLLINGEPRETTGKGSGANPRTAIGQRADGTLILVVTDGRGTAGHIGATASDLIDIMQKYDAVNAANIDGGASTSMYYEGEYLMTSTLLYYNNNSSWRYPTCFLIK